MVKISFRLECPFESDLEAYREVNNGRGLPKVGASPVSPSLAVVGGGDFDIEAVRAFDGEVWGINGTWRYLTERGIDATFYTIDANIGILPMCRGAKRAVLASWCHPAVFDALSGANVEVADVGTEIKGNISTAATAPMIAAERGHKGLTFFGCNGSFGDQTHVDRDDSAETNFIWVECGGREFKSRPDMVAQTESLAEIIRAMRARDLPNAIRVEGDGFLPALIDHGDYDVTHACKAIHEGLEHRYA
jgi:hypothetical protein